MDIRNVLLRLQKLSTYSIVTILKPESATAWKHLETPGLEFSMQSIQNVIEDFSNLTAFEHDTEYTVVHWIQHNFQNLNASNTNVMNQGVRGDGKCISYLWPRSRDSQKGSQEPEGPASPGFFWALLRVPAPGPLTIL